jgi:hypothetical protein
MSYNYLCRQNPWVIIFVLGGISPGEIKQLQVEKKIPLEQLIFFITAVE